MHLLWALQHVLPAVCSAVSEFPDVMQHDDDENARIALNFVLDNINYHQFGDPNRQRVDHLVNEYV